MRTRPPTLDQLLNLVERAERKGGLTPAEGARLRAGLAGSSRRFGLVPDDYDKLRRRNAALTTSVTAWKKKAQTAAADTDARGTVHRVAALAQRWSHIPAKRQAAQALLSALTNQDVR